MNEVGQIGQDFLQEVLWTFKVFVDCIDALQVIHANMSRSRNKANFPYFGRHVFSSCERDDAVRGEDLAENMFFFPTHHFRPVKATRQLLG